MRHLRFIYWLSAPPVHCCLPMLAFGGDVDCAGDDLFITVLFVGALIFTGVFKKGQKRGSANANRAKPFVIPPKADDKGSSVPFRKATGALISVLSGSAVGQAARKGLVQSRHVALPGLYHTGIVSFLPAAAGAVKKDGYLPRTRNLDVGECYIERYTTDRSHVYPDCWIEEQKITYIVSDEDQNRLIKGNESTVYQLWYRWQLQRPLSRPEGWKLHRVDKLAMRNR